MREISKVTDFINRSLHPFTIFFFFFRFYDWFDRMSIIRQVKSSNLKLISWKKIKRHVKGKLTSAFGRAIQSSNSDGPACYPGEKHHKLKLTEGEEMKKKKQTTEKSQTNQQILIESQIKMKVHWGKKWIGQPNEYPPCPTKEKDHNAPQNPSNRWGY